MSDSWFGPKRYGIGLSPRRPIGWVVTGMAVAFMIVAAVMLPQLGAPAWLVVVAVLVPAAVLVRIAVAKSDRNSWRWRWGERRGNIGAPIKAARDAARRLGNPRAPR